MQVGPQQAVVFRGDGPQVPVEPSHGAPPVGEQGQTLTAGLSYMGRLGQEAQLRLEPAQSIAVQVQSGEPHPVGLGRQGGRVPRGHGHAAQVKICQPRHLQTQIEGLRILVRPRDCEKFCPYPAVCRIEKWKLPLILQEIREEENLGA